MSEYEPTDTERTLSGEAENDPERRGWGINRRTLLKTTAVASLGAFAGVPAMSGNVWANNTTAEETLYLSDSGLQIDDDGGAKLFEVELDDANMVAELTLLSEMDVETGGNDYFDQVDALAASPDGSTVYAIDKFSKHLGAYDVANDAFTDLGVISGLPDEVVQAAFSPDGQFVVSSDGTDDLHVVDLSTTPPEVSNTIDLDDDFDMRGADIVFDASGRLYIFTNGGDSTNGRGLYKIDDIDATQPISPVFVGTVEPPYFTGLAIRAAGTGDLVASAHTFDDDTNTPTNSTGSNAKSQLFTLEPSDPSNETAYDTVLKSSGDDYFVGFGDMTVGVLESCETTLELCAGQDIDVGTVTITESGGELSVIYDLNEPWVLCEAHVDVGDEYDDFHTNKSGNPKVGQFDLSEEYEPCVSEFPYTAFTVGCDSEAFDDVAPDAETLYVAVHGVVRPEDGCVDFSAFETGESVEGLGTAISTLDIESTSGVSGAEAVSVKEGLAPRVYGAPNDTLETNGCLGDGFADVATRNAGAPHAYEFTVMDGVTLSDFSLRMLDFGDFNPDKDAHHYAAMVAYDGDGNEVDRMELEYYTNAQSNPTTAWTDAGKTTVAYSDLQVQGDACDAAEGEPGNWVWSVSGSGIARVELTFGDGHDPNIAFTDLCFTSEGEETAWVCEDQGGVTGFPGNNWATYFTYELCGAPGGLNCDV